VQAALLHAELEVDAPGDREVALRGIVDALGDAHVAHRFGDHEAQIRVALTVHV
jgi:hypothetical protein